MSSCSARRCIFLPIWRYIRLEQEERQEEVDGWHWKLYPNERMDAIISMYDCLIEVAAYTKRPLALLRHADGM